MFKNIKKGYEIYVKEIDAYLEREQKTEEKFKAGELSDRDFEWECIDRRNERNFLDGMSAALGLNGKEKLHTSD